MRIRDWSSDVCSSDLLPCDCTVPNQASIRSNSLAESLRPWPRQRATTKLRKRAAKTSADAPCSNQGSASLTTSSTQRDRKSVVEGKSVPLRLGLGGRRPINTTTHVKHTAINTE